MLRLAFDFIITWRETRTRPNAYVSATGDVKDVKVMRSLDPYCDKEAIRVIQSLPKWIPGRQNGRNVPVYYTVPITFKLQ